VRRIRLHAQVEVIDDRGSTYDAVVTELTPDRVVLTVSGSTARHRESPLDLTLALALLKGSKIDLVIEKATELGVTRVVLFHSTRALGGSGRGRLERWRRIAISAAKQCGRERVPEIAGPETLEVITRRPAELRLVCWEAAQDQAAPSPRSRISSLLVVVGPEGGFDDAEVDLLQHSGFRPISLGPRILRGETAAIVASALAQARWGDLARGGAL
jgi:16S rRNA (uracil1498-N3)-methyltransferase